MSKPKRLQDGPERTIDVQRKARRDFLLIAVVVVVACVAVLTDPDKVFEWVAQHKEVLVDEFLVAVVFIGTGFALFSWRRWTDLSRITDRARWCAIRRAENIAARACSC